MHLTQASCTVPDGTSVLSVSTEKIKNVPVATVSSKGPRQALLDVSFFEGDEYVEFKCQGNAPISLAGSIAIFGGLLPPESDDEAEAGDADEANDDAEEEEEEIDEDEEAPAAPAPVKHDKPLSAVEKMKLKRQREEDGASKPSAAAPDDSQQGKVKQQRTEVAGAAAAANEQQKQPKSILKKGDAEAATAPKPKAEDKKADGEGGAMKMLAGGKVKYSDIITGMGPKPTKGKKVTVAYIGRLKDGKVFDKSSNFSFRLGVGEVIRGWDEGVAGMSVGGKRKLIIHPDCGYGKRGAPPQIPPNAVLIFEVELLKV